MYGPASHLIWDRAFTGATVTISTWVVRMEEEGTLLPRFATRFILLLQNVYHMCSSRCCSVEETAAAALREVGVGKAALQHTSIYTPDAQQ